MNERHATGGDGPVRVDMRLAARVFLPFALGYFLSYLYRSVNAVIGPTLSDEFALSAGDLGLLTAAYFIAFAAAQVPVGMFLDSHGPRRVETVLLIFAALGAFVFSVADGLGVLVFGRALIGLGVAACLMAAFKAITEWFPPDRQPMLNGFIMAAGGMGAITATAPAELIVSEYGWRMGFVVLAVATLAAAIVIGTLVPERERAGAAEGVGERLAGLRRVFSSRAFWRIAPLAAMSQGSLLSIQTLWAGPWLRDVAGLELREVSLVLLAGAVGFVLGNIGGGFLAGALYRRGVAPLRIAVCGMCVFMTMQVLLVAGWTDQPMVLWFLVGASGSTGIICFAALTREFPPSLAGRASTGQNLMIFVAAFVLQWGMGAVIGLWPAAEAGRYAIEGYQAAFAIALALQAAAMGWVFLSRPRRPRS